MWKVLLLFGFLLVAACATADLLGGFEEVDVDADDVVTAAKEGVKHMSVWYYEKYYYKLVKILKAKKQVVAGTNYELELIVGMTTCKKSEVESDEVDDCDFQDNVTTYMQCKIRVLKQLVDEHRLVYTACFVVPKPK